LQKNDPKNPLFSPVFGDSKGIGKIYIFCAENEIFIHQIREYCNRLLKQKI
jgi:acetyl esterase/lipase